MATFSYSNGGWSVESFPQFDSDNTLVLVFASPEFVDSPEPLEELRREYPRSKIIGCSSAGEIFQAKVRDRTLSVAVAQFEKSTLAVASAAVGDDDSDSFEAGTRIAKSLAAENLRSVLVLSEGLQVNATELVRGFNQEFEGKIPVTGGLAGDGDRFVKTWVIDSGVIASSHVTAVGLCGDHLHIGHGSKGGWDPFGPERLITRSKGNVLYQLDDRPALELYKTYLGDRADGLPGSALLFPLTIRGGAEEKRLVRTILAVDEESQSLTFAGDVPQGSRAQLMRTHFDRLIEGASDAAAMARGSNGQGGNSSARLAIAISCVGRRMVLGERAEEEVEAVLDNLPEGTQQVGFYSYGEISPYASGPCDLHNQTMTLTTICED